MTPELIKATEQAREFLKPIINTTVHKLGDIFTDDVKAWRLNNQMRNIEKVQKIVQESAIKVKKINSRILFEYLDGVSLEEDEILQNMWANLFANYIDSDKNLTLNVYPNILRQLSSEEVLVLKILCEDIANITNAIEHLPSQEALNNLTRLGLIISNGVPMGIRGEKPNIYVISGKPDIQTIVDYYRMNSFGVDFYLACTRSK